MKQFLLVLAFVGISQVNGAQLCERKGLGAFEANPLNCQEFFMCRKGRPVQFTCPQSMFFDVASGTCGYRALCAEKTPSLGGDDDWSEAIGPEYTPIEANPSRLMASSPVCQGAAIGAIRVDTRGCKTFFQCSKDGPVRFECPSGTLFDSNRKYCEAADIASCSFGQNTPAPSTGSSNLKEVLCTGKKVGAKFAYPTDCHKYFVCDGRNSGQILTCPRGTAYNRDRNVCDFAHNVHC
ncbi:probable endochitinase [Anopheles ziemanni]|uniref:probable endochitinase n=1 Tax=Anopheles coustani TaxID=139045 RepID=UPI00265ABAA2|nr:probable endochitinase [Anopheles coustani]XP_058170721.1 probable endochitinase [Anopheles ziemanni]